MTGAVSGIIQKSGLNQSEVDARVVAVAGDSLNSGTFFSAVVDDDGVLIVDFGQNVFAANVIVTNNNVSSKCRGLFAIRATSSSAFCEIIAASNIEVATGILSGSTGSDATATVSTHTDNKMYIENRTGAACQFNITINGPQAVNYSVT